MVGGGGYLVCVFNRERSALPGILLIMCNLIFYHSWNTYLDIIKRSIKNDLA
jgi:hypothetical protein